LSNENQWLKLLKEITPEGKHIRLTPQKRLETRRIKVSRPEGGSVSWDISAVKFGQGVRVLGAPIDPRTRRIILTPEVTEELEIWVSFILGDYRINALGYYKEACKKHVYSSKKLLPI